MPSDRFTEYGYHIVLSATDTVCISISQSTYRGIIVLSIADYFSYVHRVFSFAKWSFYGALSIANNSVKDHF